jgi:ABC transporter substrate binding protein (PQQ-dependent alcohol dehydrogenase system)
LQCLFLCRYHAPEPARLARVASCIAELKQLITGAFPCVIGPATMQFPSSFPCRFFRQHFLHLGIALLLPLVTAFSLLSAPSPADAEDTKPPREREGGFEVQVPQSPALKAIKIGYIREIGDHPRPASRLDVPPDNAGVAGAKMAVEENNAGGRFTGHDYSVEAATVSSPDEAVEALGKLYESGHNYFVVDASADALLKMSDWAKDKDILLFNVSATDVSLRQENCRRNIMHVVPDRYMLADALAQYLISQKWTNWLLVHGSTPADLAYADAVKRAANRFGATIVDTREYKDVSGGRRDDVGVIPPGKQASAAGAAFAAEPDYQIIVVADEGQLFGPYMPYRGGALPRPVAGTTGLTATTWSPGHEKWGATQANNNFEKDFNRLLLPLDYQAYVAARTVGDAITRNPDYDFAKIAAFIQGPDLQVAPFKGIKQNFRSWDGQFRQPILVATDKVPVSVSPQKGFPHASHPEIEVDTLGIDEPESTCKM